MYFTRDHSCPFWLTNSGCDFYDGLNFTIFISVVGGHGGMDRLCWGVTLRGIGHPINFFKSLLHCKYYFFISM